MKKSTLLVLLKYYLKRYILSLYFNNYKFKKIKILSRHACLGQEVLGRLGLEIGEINYQKHRIDSIIENENKFFFKNILDFIKIIKVDPILGIVLNQDKSFFRAKRPKFILLDSFSELADQIFIDKNNEHTKFMCVYSDIDHNIKESKNYKSIGLLSIDDLEKYYISFFEKINQKYPDIPIIFLHFSTVLDGRKKFEERAKKIEEVIQKCSLKYENLFSISVNDKFILDACKNKVDNFAYHYCDSVYQAYVEKIQSLNIWKEIQNA